MRGLENVSHKNLDIWVHKVSMGDEFGSFRDAFEKIGKWIEVKYNKFYVHSELGYISPEEFKARYEGDSIV